MNKEKINLIFDISSLSNGAIKNSSRSGIYYTTVNILKEFLKNDKLNVKPYCNIDELGKVQLALDIDFKNYDLDIISDAPINILTKAYGYFLKNRTIAKCNHKKLTKFYWDLLARLLKPIQQLQKKLYAPKVENIIKDYDVFFSPVREIKEPFKSSKLNKYLMLYDCIPLILPQYHSSASKDSWFSRILNSTNSKDNYFAISDSARNDFIKYCSEINPDKITTTLLACNENFKQKPDAEIKKAKEKYNIPMDKKYVFSLCTLEPRKNLIRTVKTFIEFIRKNNIDDLVFVLGGGHWKKFIDVLEKEIQNLGEYKDKILKIGYVDDEDLPALYSGAEWFCYTSQYEGFGLPPLEAMSCGCPVITSNNSSLPEVVGDSGIMIDWDSDEQHIKAYERYYFDKNLREKMAKKGLERSKQFSWEKCANEMINKILYNLEGEKND